MKELYSSDDDLELSLQTTLPSEFESFIQKLEDNLEQTVNRFNHLFRRMLMYNLQRKVIEEKVTFMNGLRSEWKSIVSTMKALEQFKNYSLMKQVGILKSHEKELMKEVKLVSCVGSLSLVTKGDK